MTIPSTRRARRVARQARASAVLTPAIRRWAYGVVGAAIPVAVWAGWLPATALPIMLPLAGAIFFVTDNGDPR